MSEIEERTIDEIQYEDDEEAFTCPKCKISDNSTLDGNGITCSYCGTHW